MEKVIIDGVLKAYESAIESELRSTDPLRFKRIAKMCYQAGEFAKMSILRAGPAMNEMQDDGVEYGDLLGGGMGRAPRVGLVGPGNFETDIFREAIALAGPIFKSLVEKNKQQSLDRLLDLRERLVAIGKDTKAIDCQIEEALKTEDSNADPSSFHSIVVRGRPGAGDWPEGVQSPRRAGDGEGEGSPGDVVGPGGEERVGAVPQVGVVVPG
jgi:hypothetical protein